MVRYNGGGTGAMGTKNTLKMPFVVNEAVLRDFSRMIRSFAIHIHLHIDVHGGFCLPLIALGSSPKFTRIPRRNFNFVTGRNLAQGINRIEYKLKSVPRLFQWYGTVSGLAFQERYNFKLYHPTVHLGPRASGPNVPVCT